jgi:hypothetical protein
MARRTGDATHASIPARRPMKLLLACLGVMFCMALHAAPMERGAVIHYARKDADVTAIDRMIATARLTSWRASLVWASVERRKGVYAPTPEYTRVMDQARMAHAHGLHPLLLLGYGNPLYERGGLVTTGEARNGFARYAGWVAAQMKGAVSYYEIWNEWNIGFGSTDRPRRAGSVEDYAKLVRAAAIAIHRGDPEAIVIAGGATNSDTRWFEAFGATGVLPYIDGVSIHPYNYGKPWYWSSPEAAMHWVDTVRQQMTADNDGKPVDMYVTEMGWPGNRHGYAEDVVADYLQRFMELARQKHYVRGVWWYDLVDDGDDPDNREHRFGLFRRDGEAKPAATRLAQCCRR